MGHRLNLLGGNFVVKFAKLLDVNMMVILGSLERTEAEYRRLLAAHGFRLTRVVPTTEDVSLIEAIPA